MPISKNSKIDFAAISNEMAGTVSRWFNSTIEIFDPNLKDIHYDEWTNTSVGYEILLWSGDARVQPIDYGRGDSNAGRSVLANRRVRFQVPLDQTRDFIRAGLGVRVIDGGQFPDLEKLQFTVSEAINSSYAWLLTIECEADVKSELDAGGS
jgi:hypothetical protein